jgi:putative hemolysin
LVLLAAVETLASYISRVYSEFGKILTREIEENLDAWEELVEPQLGLTREHAAISAAVLQQLALGIIALEFGAVLFDRALTLPGPPMPKLRRQFWPWCWWWFFCNQLLPTLLFNRTRGRWAARLVWPIRLLLWLMTPITVFVRFFFSVAALAEEPATARRRDRRRCRGAARSRRRGRNSGRERSRPGPLRRRIRRQAGARSNDAAS